MDKRKVNILSLSHYAKVSRAKAAAVNLGISINTKDEKIVAANKYEKPHQGRKEVNRRAKQLSRAGKAKLP